MLHVRAFKKCSQIWIGSRRPSGSGKVRKVIGKQLGYPVCTRWNSLYDCTLELLQYPMSELLVATKTKTLDSSPFTDRETKYLQEYVKLMQPLAMSLDHLQGEKNMHYGNLLPTLFSLLKHYEEMETQRCFDIVTAAVPKIIEFLKSKRRFEAEFNFEESANLSVLASVSHPAFKLRWILNSTAKEKKAKQIFKDGVAKLMEKELESVATPGPSQEQPSTSTSSFLFLKPSSSSAPGGVDNYTNQINKYLVDERNDIQMLDSYPAIRKAFKFSNTPVCSSAPLERTFNLLVSSITPREAQFPRRTLTCRSF